MSMLGRHHTDETKAKISRAHIGRPFTEETRAKISAAMKGKATRLGACLSEETRAKISSALTVKPLSPTHKHNISLALKGHHNTPKGTHLSPNTEFRSGHPPIRGMLGKTAWNKGIPWDTETKEKIRNTEKGRHLHPETEIKKGQRISPETELTSERAKSWWKDPEYRARVIAGRLKHRRPTGPEKKLIGLIAKYRLPYKYTGDGSFIIGGLNPDFVNINGAKVAIDVFGDYWHTIKADKESYNEEGRKKIFADYGWQLIVLWENEVERLPEDSIVERIRKS